MEITVHPPDRLTWNGNRVRCVLGRGGAAAEKREGDGRTPVGIFALRRVHYRADRIPVPETALPLRPIAAKDGWCDDPDHPAYNSLVTLPFAASHERLWRDDGLYDVVVELGYNDDPVRPGLGSAIFLHVAAPDYRPTEGCVAVAMADLVHLLAACDAKTTLAIKTPG